MINDRDRTHVSGKAQDLLERIKATQQSAEETLKATQEAAQQIGYIGKGIRKVGAGLSWVHEKAIDPVISLIPFVKPTASAIGRGYEWFCHPAEPFPNAVWRGVKNGVGKFANDVQNVFRGEKQDFTPSLLEMGKFSRSRAGIAALVTAFTVSPIANNIPVVGEFVPDIVSDHAVSLIYEPPYDASRMALTALFNGGSLDHETIYLNGKNEIHPDEDVWSVGGCETKPGCDQQDAVTFHIKPGLMHHAWSVATGRGLFLPDYVATPIPNVPSKCDVTSYGLRWRVSKWLNSYPQLLNAQCEALPATVAAPPAPAQVPVGP